MSRSSKSNVDNLPYISYPTEKSIGKQHILIVGGGIIGATTAFYLTQHPNFSPETHHITLIESTEVAGGASSKAGGLIATWAFPEQIVPLSFRLHEALNERYDGETNWGYRRLNALSVSADVQRSQEDQEKRHLRSQKKFIQLRDKSGLENNTYGNGVIENISNVHGSPTDYSGNVWISRDNNDETSCVDMGSGIPDDLGTGGVMMRTSHNLLPMAFDWIKAKLVKTWSYIGETRTTAQIHPYLFSHFLMERAIETGAVDLILGKVTELQVNDNGEACGVSYIPRRGNQDELVKIVNASQVVLTLGPWTSKILKTCPISSLRVHSVIVKPGNTEDHPISPYSIFSELQIEDNQIFSPEIYPRKDEIYICGEGDSHELPDSLDDVVPNRETCDELFYYVSKISTKVAQGEITERFSSYLPVLNIPTGSGPLLGETTRKNLFIATGHSCWGINNAPATGLIISQLLLEGKCTCADISSFNPAIYFDAK